MQTKISESAKMIGTKRTSLKNCKSSNDKYPIICKGKIFSKLNLNLHIKAINKINQKQTKETAMLKITQNAFIQSSNSAILKIQRESK